MLGVKVQRNGVDLSRIGNVGTGGVSTLRKHCEVIHRECMEMYLDRGVPPFHLQSKPVVRF